MASWVAEKVSDSSPILGTMLEKTSIEPHHVGSNRRALRMNGPASQDYGFSHPQLLHLFYLDSFIYQVSAAAPLLRPLGVAQPSSLVLYLGPSAAANNNLRTVGTKARGVEGSRGRGGRAATQRCHERSVVG